MESKKQLEHIAEMRALMERSTRFLSLSGLSGIWAGAWALIGVAVVFWYLDMSPFDLDNNYHERAIRTVKWGMGHRVFFPLLGAVLLAIVLGGGLYFTLQKARKRGEGIWDSSSRRFAYALFTPLITGGILSLALLWRDYINLVAPITLIFYGLSLVNGAAYTLRDVRYLGYLEVLLGLTGIFLPGYGLEIWAIGFGILHIIYGLLMHVRYG